MADLPPLITTIEDRMAWAAYVSYIALEPFEECISTPNYRDFKNQRLVWDAVARGVVDAAAQFINEIKEKAIRYDQMVGVVTIEPEDRASHPIWHMRCDHCGRERLDAAKSGSTHCSAPFTVQEHAWNGLHPSHRVTIQQILDAEAAYFSAKNDMQASTAHGRAKTEEKLRIWNALKAKYTKQDAEKHEDPSARDILHEIRMEGLRNHNTRCRPWWHKVVDFFAEER